VSRPHRAVVAVLLALLLLAMQHEGQRHALSHGTQLPGRGQEQSLSAEVESACAECALLAAGAHGIAGGSHALPIAAIAQLRGRYAPVSAPVAAPFYYRSRAPPSFL